MHLAHSHPTDSREMGVWYSDDKAEHTMNLGPCNWGLIYVTVQRASGWFEPIQSMIKGILLKEQVLNPSHTFENRQVWESVSSLLLVVIVRTFQNLSWNKMILRNLCFICMQSFCSCPQLKHLPRVEGCRAIQDYKNPSPQRPRCSLVKISQSCTQDTNHKPRRN